MRRITALVLLAAAFAVVEAALAVDLRALVDPDGSRFPLVQLPAPLERIERLREMATLLLLWSAAELYARGSGVQRFAAFLLVFGVWDIGYYVALRAMLGWPESLRTWDLLFLVPRPWLAPVWAPLTVAAAMVCAGAATLAHIEQRGVFALSRWHVASAVVSAALLLASFIPGPATVHFLPQRFRVELWGFGVLLGLVAFTHAWRRNRASSSVDAARGTATDPGVPSPREPG